mgnify:CR=1 FL=1
MYGLKSGTDAGFALVEMAVYGEPNTVVKNKFGEKLATINEGIRKDGAFYLFTLRLVPIFPFFVINLVLGLTPIRAGVFYLVSQVGMLPGTLVYVNAGTQLAGIAGAPGVSDLLVAPWLADAGLVLGQRRALDHHA